MRVSQGKPVHFRVSARRPATGRLEFEAIGTVRVWGPGLDPRSDPPTRELPLEWSSDLLRYVGRASTEGWEIGRHTAVAEVRDSASGELLGDDSVAVDVTVPRVSVGEKGV